MRYQQIVRAVLETPWAIRREMLAVICELVALRAGGARLDDVETAALADSRAARSERSRSSRSGTVAILPLYGPIVSRAGILDHMSGATSLERWGATLSELVDDPSVDAILIDVDSPGGMTDLVPETAAQVREARERKPIVAIANTDAASAAYWIASQASEIVATPSGSVGSIGIYAAHQDMSGAMEKAGIRTTLISAGRRKIEGHPFAPLDDEARAAIQERVDAYYSMFVDDVARGRQVSVETVRDGYGQGRVLTAQAALEQGMIDRIETIDATISRLMQSTGSEVTAATGFSRPTGAAASGLSLVEEADAVRDSAARLLARTASLAEVERGHLTVAKRERLSACTEELRESVRALEALLAGTDTTTRSAAVVERARFERRRATLRRIP